MKGSQSIRICSGAVSFYTTAKQIRNGVGDYDAFNTACEMALNSLETGTKHHSTLRGLVSTYNGINLAIDMVEL